jgi:sporadic carbohydrate cluster 2OG-Fe(II) oxygenase
MSMARYDGPEKPAFLADLAEAHLLNDQQVRVYDDASYTFQELLLSIASEKGLTKGHVSSLRDLHKVVADELKILDDAQISPFTAAFYEPGDEIVAEYHRFVSQEIAPLVGEPIYHQKTPTIRFQFPHQQNFGPAPKWHSDIMLGHPPAEINVWLPLTAAYDSNTMRMLDRTNSDLILTGCSCDFTGFDERGIGAYEAASKPIEMSVGQYLIFNPRCIHATQYNETNDTRVSIDFRVITVRAFERLRLAYRGTGRKPMPFAPGGYYDGAI